MAVLAAVAAALAFFALAAALVRDLDLLGKESREEALPCCNDDRGAGGVGAGGRHA